VLLGRDRLRDDVRTGSCPQGAAAEPADQEEGEVVTSWPLSPHDTIVVTVAVLVVGLIGRLVVGWVRNGVLPFYDVD
jgi:hypothetical protein